MLRNILLKGVFKILLFPIFLNLSLLKMQASLVDEIPKVHYKQY